MTTHQHRHDLQRPWILLQQVLSFKVKAIREAAELQVRSREPVIWHPDVETTSHALTSCFTASRQYSPAGRPPGVSWMQAAVINRGLAATQKLLLCVKGHLSGLTDLVVSKSCRMSLRHPNEARCSGDEASQNIPGMTKAVISRDIRPRPTSK